MTLNEKAKASPENPPGQGQDAISKITGSTDKKAEGKANQIEGETQKASAELKHEINLKSEMLSNREDEGHAKQIQVDTQQAAEELKEEIAHNLD